MIPALQFLGASGTVTGSKFLVIVEGVAYQGPRVLAPGITVTFRGAVSGDLGRYGAPLLPDPAPIGEADYIVVESRYGDREHSVEPISAQLERVVTEAVARGGAIIVPAFAMGRTQELMFHLAALEKAGRIPSLPTYVDSPMAIHGTESSCAHPRNSKATLREMIMTRKCPLECADVRLARTPDESRSINAVPGPVLIVSRQWHGQWRAGAAPSHPGALQGGRSSCMAILGPHKRLRRGSTRNWDGR